MLDSHSTTTFDVCPEPVDVRQEPVDVRQEAVDVRPESIDVGQESFRWSALEIAQVYADFSDPLHPPPSQRQYAAEHGIPRSTLAYQLNKDFPADLDPALVHFFRLPAGVTFLRRLVLALLITFHHRCPCGLRPIADCLRLAQLDAFVATSYGALYDLDLWLQTNLPLFADEERQRLTPGMLARDIALILDEHFHARKPCLVGIEPVSNFILVEIYQDRRDSQTWAKVIATGVEGLPVHIVLFTSDQASGLIRCAKDLQAQHQPDLMHLQRDLCGPVLLPLARPIQQAQKGLEKTEQAFQQLEEAEKEKPGSVCWDDVAKVVAQETDLKKQLEQAQEQLEQAAEAIRGVSENYHPFDREKGQPVSAEQMQGKLDAEVAQLQETADEAELPQRSQEAIHKARGWVVLLVGCLAWFWGLVNKRLEELDLDEEAEQLLRECLISSYYWERASQKEKDPAERKRLKELAEELRARAWQPGGALANLPAEERATVERVARQCAELFVRSSSCVEGRNGRLSLFHHGQTRLSQQRLKALTAVHNYVVRSPDGTTAAERFFGQEQRDVFSWLLQRMPDLPQPAAKRPKKPSDNAATAA